MSSLRLLIITQKVDPLDPILGFFERWLKKFSEHTASLTVIGQLVHPHSLPEDITVRSMEKENGASKLSQIFSFYRHSVRERHSYDAVLVHMTPIWVVFGFPLWFVLRKRVYLWYEVRRGGFVLRLATLFSKKVFSATPYGLPWPSPKQVVTGHGIDTEFFHTPTQPRDPHLLLAVGRITPIKHLEIFLDALATLPTEYRLQIIGGTITPSDTDYLSSLKQQMERLNIRDRVKIAFGTQAEVAEYMRKASIFLHAADGGLDKAILEAMSCGCRVLCTSSSAASMLPEESVSTKEAFSDRLYKALQVLPPHDAGLRKIIEEHHSLPALINRLTQEMLA